MSTTPMRCPDQLSGQKILVTGASGFLGSHLTKRLARQGAEVHGVSRSLRTAQTDDLRWWQGDMADVAIVREVFRKVMPDVIFHLSGLVTARPDLDLVLPTLHSLLVSTVNVLTAATEVGCCRIVLVGSLNEPAADLADATPDSPYAAAKWAGSAYGRMFYKLYKTSVVNARLFMTYGPGQDSYKLIPYTTLSLLRGERPKLSSGQWQGDWIYVDDAIEGLLMAAQAPGIEGCTIDLGSGVLVPVRTIVQYLMNLTGSQLSPLFGAVPDRPFEPLRVADTASAYAKLGWTATTPLEDGLRRTVDWYARG